VLRSVAGRFARNALRTGIIRNRRGVIALPMPCAMSHVQEEIRDSWACQVHALAGVWVVAQAAA
jgi:hypothetical protein